LFCHAFYFLWKIRHDLIRKLAVFLLLPGGYTTLVLATTAVALVALSGAASAQSVLERVLGQIDNATNLASVNGTFANIAENIGGTTTVYYDSASNTTLTADQLAALQAAPLQTDYTVIAATDYVSADGASTITSAAYANLSAADKANYSLAGAAAYYVDGSGAVINAAEWGTYYATATALNTAVGAYEAVTVAGLQGVNGSINNTIDGINGATQEAIAAIDVSAIEWNMPTFDFGDMATTALGAVNTGDITLGVNSSVDEAKTSTTNAISGVISQLGGSADTGAIVLNVASNMTGVNGSINNVMEQVNGSIGNLSTTALGAVNTGTIISGVDAAVAGIVGSTSGGSNGL
jgi:hypothetical protein